MSIQRRRLAAATLVGLGTLAGVAMETNHGLPSEAPRSSASTALVTQASGAAAPTSTEAAGQKGAPIVTRASGGGLAAPATLDD